MSAGWVRVRARCECGGSLDVTARGPGADDTVYVARTWFVTEHRGPGHRLLRAGERRPRRRASETVGCPADLRGDG